MNEVAGIFGEGNGVVGRIEEFFFLAFKIFIDRIEYRVLQNSKTLPSTRSSGQEAAHIKKRNLKAIFAL